MPFCKFLGIILVILGIVLLCVQAVLYFSPKEVPLESAQSSTPVQQNTNLVGIGGFACIVIGTGLFATARRRDGRAD